MNPFYDLPEHIQEALADRVGGDRLYVPKRPRLTQARILAAIIETGNAAAAAEQLGVSRQAIYARLKRPEE